MITAEFALEAYRIGWQSWGEFKDCPQYHTDPVYQERFNCGWKDRDTFEYCKRKDESITKYGRPCRMLWRNAVTNIR